MRTTLLTALALLLATPAWACDEPACRGKVVAMGNPVTITIQVDSAHDDDCFINDKKLAQRVLKVCPIGSDCVLSLGEKDYKVQAGRPLPTRLILKWPRFGVEKQ
jgi:hypothetical protein